MERIFAPFEAALLLTFGCNLKCPFCYERGWSAKGALLSPQEWLQVLHELSEMKVMKVHLLGGEPLVSPAWEPVIREIPRLKMRFLVISNGTLIDERQAQLLAESRRCDLVQISLDGPEAVHDKLRGRGCFRKAISAIHLLADAGIPVNINSVIVRSLGSELDRFLELLESLPIHTYRLSLMGGDVQTEERLDFSELVGIGAHLLSRQHELRKISPKSFPLIYRKFYNTTEKDDDNTGQCSRSRIQINIHPDGAVTPCPDLRDPVAGFAIRQPLAEIWQGRLLTDFRSRSRKDKKLPFEKCETCRWRAVCRRHCPLFNPGELCMQELFQCWSDQGLEL